MGEPSTGRLLETIERFPKATYMMRKFRVFKTAGLTHVNLFRQVTMKKSISDIKLTDGPLPRKNKRKNNANNNMLNNRTESFQVVNAILLMKPIGHKTGLIPFNGTIGAAFDTEHPFARQGMAVRGRRNKIPSMIVMKGLDLCEHSLAPLIRFVCFSERGRFDLRYLRKNKICIFGIRFSNPISQTSDHGVGSGKEGGRG
ncbi:unnamed protein product [Prunus armeniaca]|uniref:Uncharacterized protein n=1 Tax=Prunus armeniaca TaxID=36596 RepID=A0A6J5W6G3_PRUAR|nr:unnamed protein product [Prunus armeniaca]